MKGVISIVSIVTIIAWIVGFIVYGFHAPAEYSATATVLFKTCSVIAVLCVVGWKFTD